MTKTVKYYSSEDQGAPVVKQAGWGSIVNLYRQICRGYNEQNIESILYSAQDKLVTINFTNSSHGYRKYQTILIFDTSSQYNNEELFIVSVSSTSIKCKTKKVFSEELTSASAKCKVAPLGMTEAFTNGVGKSAFKFEDPHGENVYLCINDTEPTAFVWNSQQMLSTPSIYMCKNLVELDGDSDLPMPYNNSYPNAHKQGEWKSGSSKYWAYGLGNIMYQNSIYSNSGYSGQNNTTFNINWTIIGNGSFHYLYFYVNSYYEQNDEPILYQFGAFKKKYEYDKCNYIMKISYNSAYLIDNYHFYQIYANPSNFYEYYTSFSTCVTNTLGSTNHINTRKTIYSPIQSGKIADNITQSDNLLMKGITSENRTSFFTYPKKYTNNTYSGAGQYSYPLFDGSTVISKLAIYESSGIERGELPGAYWIHHDKPFVNKSINKIIDETGYEFYTINMTHYASPYTTSSSLSINRVDILISLDDKDW